MVNSFFLNKQYTITSIKRKSWNIYYKLITVYSHSKEVRPVMELRINKDPKGDGHNNVILSLHVYYIYY